MEPAYSKLHNSAITLFILFLVSCSTPEPVPIKVVADFSSTNNNILVGKTVSFSDESEGNPTSWDWEFPGGSPAFSTSQNPTVTYTTSGAFDVKLTASSTGSEQTKTRSSFIIVNEAVVADFTANSTEIAEGESVIFIDESKGVVTSWNWTFENGTPSTSTEQNPTVVFDVAGQYTVTLKVADNLSESTETKAEYVLVRSAIVDLTVLNPSISSTTITMEETFTIGFDIKNIGGLSVTDAIEIQFWYTNDNPDEYFSEYLSSMEIQGLNSGETKSFTKDLVIPSTVSSGTGYITIWVDPNDLLEDGSTWDNNFGQIDITLEEGVAVSITPDLDGLWESSTIVIEIDNGSGYFREINNGSWLEAFNKGYVSLGDTKVKNIVQRANQTNNYDCDWLWNTTTNGAVTGVKWSDSNTSVINLKSANEFEICSQLTNGSNVTNACATYTRKN